MRILTIIVALTVSTSAGAAEEKIAFDAAPAAVQATMKKAIGTGTLHEVTRESEDGKITFEANYNVDKAMHSVKVDEAGKLLEKETQIDAKALPAAVSQAVMKLYSAAKIEEVVLVTAGDKTFYELEIEVAEVDRELKIDPNGKVLEDKVQTDKEDGHDHHDEKHEGKNEKD